MKYLPYPVPAILLGLYGLQLFVVVPWFSGAIYRHEQSFWIVHEVVSARVRHGLGDAWFSGYLYLLYYSAFWSIPYAFLKQRAPDKYPSRHSFDQHCIWQASWIAFTLLLFGEAIFSFTRNLPLRGWYSLLLIPWFLLGVVARPPAKKQGLPDTPPNTSLERSRDA